MDSISKTKRNYSLDFLKLFAIYWVVLIQHNFAPLGDGVDWHWVDGADVFVAKTAWLNIFTPYTMPICFMISGIVAGLTNTFHRSTFRVFLINKTKRLYIPCVLGGATFCLIREHTILEPRIFFRGYMHFWFVGYLFWFFIISWWSVRRLNRMFFIIPLLTCVLFFILNNLNFELKTPQSMCENYMYFSFGFCISTYYEKLKTIKLPISLIAIILLILSFLYNNPVIYSFKILVVCFVIALLALNINIDSLKQLHLFYRTSYGVYLYHLIVLFILYRLVIHIGVGRLFISIPWIMSTSLALCSLIVSFLLTTLTMKINKNII